MLTSLHWLHQYLRGAALSGERAEAMLMALGLPSDSRSALSDGSGDELLDVEVTSNRGDCLSHVGLARELAAHPQAQVQFAPPTPARLDEDTTSPAGSLASVTNQAPDHCPLFLARVVRGVRVGPSPDWLRKPLEAVGQRSINNVVDATNFVALELGNPCHAFDLAKLPQGQLVVRLAHAGEKLTTLDGKPRTLAGDEVVIADAQRARSLAGVMGGQDSEVTGATTDVLIEMATWAPATVRRAARRHQLRTTASHRYERIVDARTLDEALARVTELIVRSAGGRVCAGVLRAPGKHPAPPPTTVRLRPRRIATILGIELPMQRLGRHLGALGIEVGPMGRAGDELLCTIPPWRPDLTREIDLIEEVARVEGLDAIPMQESIRVRISSPQPRERARRACAEMLAGLGFFETVTFSFTTPAHARAFTPAGLEAVVMDDARRGNEPALRPSVLPGLLACRRHNQFAGVHTPGGVRLCELASTFAQRPSAPGTGQPPTSVEQLSLALLMDCPGPAQADKQRGLRTMRGVVEALCQTMAGAGVPVRIAPCAAPPSPAFDAQACAGVHLGELLLGHYGLPTPALLAGFDLAQPVVLAELAAEVLWRHYPPKSVVATLPSFPAIERDLSLVVDEQVPYQQLADALARHAPPRMEGLRHITTYRGKPIAPGKKSVTVRLAFRDGARTLTNEELDAPMAQLLEALRASVAFELRA